MAGEVSLSQSRGRPAIRGSGDFLGVADRNVDFSTSVTDFVRGKPPESETPNAEQRGAGTRESRKPKTGGWYVAKITLAWRSGEQRTKKRAVGLVTCS